MNPPSGPPPPPPAHPREAFLYKFKGEFIALMLHYKAGMFRGKINWSVKLVDFFDVLLQSPAIDKSERLLFAKLACQIGTLTSIADPDNSWIGQTTRQEHHHTMQLLRAMVDVEKATRGRHSLTGSLRNAGFNNLSFEVGINGAGQVSSARSKENARYNNQPPGTPLPMGMQAASNSRPVETAGTAGTAGAALLSGMPGAASGSFQLPMFDNQDPPQQSGHPYIPPSAMDSHFEGLGEFRSPMPAANDTNSGSASNAGNQWQNQQPTADDWLARAWQMQQ
ncbi:hypothetical protein G647_04305 [Cladophialophora carrionii CBS 160.54]|uniref:Uncharacterized protein n=1 Tax=Cladophialophora carrionii CBS 160.54 TaxID=1279043 RepID=V9DDM0_9EURO|nr:uncharacterized protein G647_04305 [Cladophialophora carrionii CBS 160.54]ETI24935.1 hypothetical protein G647_04305 [Cladophialophora carrionii CBS 160.54]